MKRILLILILCFATTAFSQTKDVVGTSERVDSKKPTVYLRYVCQDEKKIFLRMHNNTIWHISVEAEKSYFPTKKPISLQNGAKVYAIPNNEEVPIFYYVEKDEFAKNKVKVPKIEHYFRNGGGWIASQDSILLSVPIEYVRKELKVYVGFSYEWELVKAGDINREVEHRVYFRGGDIGSANTDIEPTACQK